MDKIKAEFIDPAPVVVTCPSFFGIVKKGDVISITEKELEELGPGFRAVATKKEKGKIDG